MKILRSKKDIGAFMKLLRERASGGSRETEQKVKTILDDVMANGDRALFKYTKAFDSLTTKRLNITSGEITRHAKKAKKDVVEALKISAKRIRSFHEKQKEKSWSFAERGNLLGQLDQAA